MKTRIEGLAYVLGDDIDTDQIIPAEHLVYSLADEEERKQYGRFALSGVPDHQCDGPFVPEGWRSPYAIIVAGDNFGSGSSREHAPACLEIAGVQAVIANSYARIFYRNVVAGARFSPIETDDSLNKVTRTGDRLIIDLEALEVENATRGTRHALRSLGEVQGILDAGGIFAFARQHGLISTVEG
jgi:3-isopropylmalate/(R)-2-methylmalate dehydratase small subunit